MRTRLSALSGWLVAALVVLGGWRHVASQPGIPEGAFVVAADGRHWVAGAGQRLPIQFHTDDSGALAALPTGPAVSTLAEANAALAAPPVPAAAGTLVGQIVSTCKGPARFDIEVERALSARVLAGVTAEEGTLWVLAVVSVTNTGAERSDIDQTLRLRDERGRPFSARSPGPAETLALAAEYAARAPSEAVAPGSTERAIITFQVAADAQRLTLEAELQGCP